MTIVEQRTYVLKPEYSPGDFFSLYEATGREVQLSTLQGFRGYFAVEIGPLNAVTSLWSYPSFEVRLERRAALARDPRWQSFLGSVRPMLHSMENKILLPAAFSPLQ